MKSTTGLGIRFNQLVVGGFIIKDTNVAGESTDGRKAMITQPRYYYAGDFAGEVVMDNEADLYQREVTMMYKLERDEQHYARPNDFLAIKEPQRILNQDRVQINRQELRGKIADFSRPWYHHSSGTVSRKPLFPGQEPAKNVVVVKPFLGGFRRGQEPSVSALTSPNKSVGFKFPERGLNKGLTKEEIEALSVPVLRMKHTDYIGQIPSGLGLDDETRAKMFRRLRKVREQ
jgi:hypothetical protein